MSTGNSTKKCPNCQRHYTTAKKLKLHLRACKQKTGDSQPYSHENYHPEKLLSFALSSRLTDSEQYELPQTLFSDSERNNSDPNIHYMEDDDDDDDVSAKDGRTSTAPEESEGEIDGKNSPLFHGNIKTRNHKVAN